MWLRRAGPSAGVNDRGCYPRAGSRSTLGTGWRSLALRTRDDRIRYRRTRTATTLMPNRKPTDCGSQFRLLEDPIFPPIWRVVFPIINRKLKKVENSYEKRAMLKT